MEQGKKVIKAIIFDVGGVVIFYDHMIAAKKMSKIIGVPAKKILRIISESGSKNKFMELLELGASSEVYWKEASRQLGVKNLNPRKFNKIWNTIFWPNKEIISIIQELKKKYKIAILSNIPHTHKKYLSKIYNLKELFPVRIFSCDVKTRKPESKIFRITLNKLRVKPEETWFIDDKRVNIQGAKKLGMKTILFKNNRQTIRELEKLLK